MNTLKISVSVRRALVTAIPLIFVNIVAFSGQFGFLVDHVPWPTIGLVIMALALESIALFLAYMAHSALKAEDTAYGLRLASYAFGFIIGLMNYSHYAGPHWAPTFLAIATGVASMVSPWLWGIYSRRQSRDVLKAKGLIEPRAVKLGALRWILHTENSWRVFRRAVWKGENQPQMAIGEWEAETKPELARAWDIAGLEGNYSGEWSTADMPHLTGLDTKPEKPVEADTAPLVPDLAGGWESEAEWEAALNKAAEDGQRERDLEDALVRGEARETLPEPTGPELTNGQEILEAHSNAVANGCPVTDPPAPRLTSAAKRGAKTEAVRNAIKTHPRTPIKDIVTMLSEDGWNVTPGYVSSVKQRMKR